VDRGLHRFARLLRSHGIRVSITEVLDAMTVAQALGFRDRQTLKEGLGAALVKEQRDWPMYEDLFERYFRVSPLLGQEAEDRREHGHDHLSDQSSVARVTLSEEPSTIPDDGHSHDDPVDIREYFDPRDLATQYNLHQPAEKIDIASLTEQLILSKEPGAADDRRNLRTVQLDTMRLRGASSARDLSAPGATRISMELTIAEQDALLDWLDDGSDSPEGTAARRRQVEGMIANLPELLKAHLERLAAQGRKYETRDASATAYVERISEDERAHMEDALRRLTSQLKGALTHRKRVGPRGRVDVGRTMRANLRSEGVPFHPITMARTHDRPRLVVLVDVSLSVRNSARFTLHMVHGLQRLVPRVRTFAFVNELVEVTELFHDQPLERALGLLFGGDVIDVAAPSDYGRALRQLRDHHLSAVTHRSTLLVLGDGRGNGNDPELAVFETVARQARSVLWLTPEPQYSWALGQCDLPLYAEWCDRIEVVRDFHGLEHTLHQVMAAVAGGRHAG
jgi:hypothetical protein